jgi:small nuclear ribonucleoprotein (snRNP)-like protein
MSSPPPYMSFASPAALVTPGFHDSFLASPISTELVVRALLHDDQLIRGTFVSFDPVWNPILRDCVELHPQADRHVPGPLVFPRAVTASLAVEPVSSPSPPRASNGAPPLVLSAHTVLSSPPPPSPTTDWVIYSGASFHTTPTASSLSYSHPPHPSHPPSIVVGNGSTLPVTSVGASVLPGPFSLNDVLVSPGLTHPHLSVRRITSDNHCSMEFDPWGLIIRHLPTRAVLARCDSSGPLYSLHLTSTPPTSVTSSHALATTTTSVIWHRRLGHPRPDVMSQLSSRSGISYTRGSSERLCHACQLGRHTRLPFSTSTSRAAQAFDLVHCDL